MNLHSPENEGEGKDSCCSIARLVILSGIKQCQDAQDDQIQHADSVADDCAMKKLANKLFPGIAR
jgi:hypothetical protein